MLDGGDAGEDVFTAIGEDWDIEERTRAQLDRLGLGHIAFDRRLGSLSDDEVVSLGLAAQLLKRPDVLLLDEPTNNLDVDARHRLYGALDDCPGVSAAGQPRPGAAGPDGPHRRAVSRRNAVLRRQFHVCIEQSVQETQQIAEENLRNAEQLLKRESVSGRRPASGPTAGRAPRHAT